MLRLLRLGPDVISRVGALFQFTSRSKRAWRVDYKRGYQRLPTRGYQRRPLHLAAEPVAGAFW